MEVNSFIALVAPGAVNAMLTRKILASVSIAQAALESGWGEHAPGNNLFGIKSNGWAASKCQTLQTKEVVKGKTVTVSAQFRKYGSWAESITDHADFLVQNSRYKNLIGDTNYKTVCVKLQSDSYSTAPNYAQELTALIEQHSLAKYDKASPITQVDCPKQGQTYSGDVPFYGWAVAAGGVKEVGVYLDNNRPVVGITALASRPDVNKIINPNGVYKDAEHSGYSGKIPHSTLTKGKHTVHIAGVASDGSSPCWASIDFYVK